jgi:hypothetical protein
MHEEEEMKLECVGLDSCHGNMDHSQDPVNMALNHQDP